MTTETLPEITIDVTAVGKMTTRKWLISSMKETGCKYKEVRGFWHSFGQGKSYARVPSGALVIGDLARIVKHYRNWSRTHWVAAVRQTRPYFLAFMRTRRDLQYASVVDDLLRDSDMRVLVCDSPTDRATTTDCLLEALQALRPDALIEIRYCSEVDRLWVVFGDGLSGSVSWRQLGIEDVRSSLVAESATLGDAGHVVQMNTTDDELFEIDAASIRGLLDAAFANELADRAGAAERTVGQRLRLARKERGLTQKELSNRSGMDQAIISKLERGKHTPRLDTLRRMTKALELSLPELLSADAPNSVK